MIEEKAVCNDTFPNIFNYQVILVFCKIPCLLSLIWPILGHQLSVKTTGFILLRQKYLPDLTLKTVLELLFLHIYFFSRIWIACLRITLGLFELSLYLIYLTIRDSTCTFLAFEMELFMAVVNYVYSVTIAIDSNRGPKFTAYYHYYYYNYYYYFC